MKLKFDFGAIAFIFLLVYLDSNSKEMYTNNLLDTVSRIAHIYRTKKLFSGVYFPKRTPDIMYGFKLKNL
jgi:hypothetical protein